MIEGALDQVAHSTLAPAVPARPAHSHVQPNDERKKEPTAMTKTQVKALISSALLLTVICCTQVQQPGNNSNTTNSNTAANVGATPPAGLCTASPQWVNNPQSGPSEIPGGGTNLCQFHQFSWQWFLALMNTPATGGATRNYQIQQNFPQLEIDVNSCTSTSVKTRLFVRTRKDDDNKDDFIMPERIGQAGGGATIYDQNGDVVFYEVRFSRSMCSVDPTAKMFPAGTMEIKVSYRIITDAEAPNYVTIKANVVGDPQEETLGMVGFHLVISTPTHPEFIWATFEHRQNAPDCQVTADASQKWSFTSAQCAGQLPNSVNTQLCNFNIASPATAITGGTPTQICRVYHAGSKPGDNQYDANVADIDTLNKQMFGILSVLPQGGSLGVLKNYHLVGALWENDITQPSSNLGNQRGSIQLANTTMETTHQQGDLVPYTGTSNLQPATNCFGCHAYVPGNNVQISHIFDDITAQQQKLK